MSFSKFVNYTMELIFLFANLLSIWSQVWHKFAGCESVWKKHLYWKLFNVKSGLFAAAGCVCRKLPEYSIVLSLAEYSVPLFPECENCKSTASLCHSTKVKGIGITSVKRFKFPHSQSRSVAGTWIYELKGYASMLIALLI